MRRDKFLSVNSVEKRYGEVNVVDGVTIDFHRGSIHGLVGENGAGKSTLAKMMAGVVTADGGYITIDELPIRLRSPRDALRHGVTMLSQELSIVPHRTVLENVFLGSHDHVGGFVLSSSARRRFFELRDYVDLGDLAPDRLVRDLSLAQQQQVEVMRAIGRGAKMVIFDEPTAILSAHEASQMLDLMRRLAHDGMSIVLISHFLEEILSVADTVSVMRDGALISTGAASDQTKSNLITEMVGRFVDVLYPEMESIPERTAVMLEVKDIRRAPAVNGVSLKVRQGEIVGLAGLVGSGRTETARLIFGADRADSGTIIVNGRQLDAKHPVDSIARGVVMVPENRKEEGLVLNLSIYDNIALANLRTLSKYFFVRPKHVHRSIAELISRFDIRASNLAGPISTFSGGNQQKVLIAKWLLRPPSVLIVDEPTRGVDIRSKAEIHRLLRDLAAKGLAILLISSEIEEVMGLSHLVHIVRDGKIVQSFVRGEADRTKMLSVAFGESVDERAERS